MWDYEELQPIAQHALTILINISDDGEVLTALAEDEEFLESVLGRVIVCGDASSVLFVIPHLSGFLIFAPKIENFDIVLHIWSSNAPKGPHQENGIEGNLVAQGAKLTNIPFQRIQRSQTPIWPACSSPIFPNLNQFHASLG